MPHVPEPTVVRGGGEEPQSSQCRHVLCVVYSGGALAVLLQFIHAAVTSQPLVLYN